MDKEAEDFVATADLTE